MKKELVISKIEYGTVIDHINAGKALLVLRILGIKPGSGEMVTMAMNVPSKKMGKKDIVKVAGKFISEEELNKIALIAPKATINLIENYEIKKKFKVTLPKFIEGILRCPNRNCITNSREPITPKFYVYLRDDSVVAKCYYCNKVIKGVDEFVV
jgi:aspartate carbamoyltransferase regulatory subunit